jgi:hypothetical protein
MVTKSIEDNFIDYNHAILDSGSTDNVVPLTNVQNMDKMRQYKSQLKIGDNTSLPIIGKGSYGVLKDVLICDGLVYPLVSVKYLTQILKCIVFYSENRAYILNIGDNFTNIVATATVDKHDNLYHMDDMNQFTVTSNFPLRSEPDNETSLLAKVQQPFYSTREMKLGSARNFVKNSRQFLNLLQWVHVRLGHPSQQALKRIVKDQAVLGLGVTWDEIKDMDLGICNSCLRSRMHAFPIPKSISRTTYQIFEYITCDYCPMKVESTRGYTGIYIYGDKQSEMLFGYLVKSKTEWLQTFQSLIDEYGPKKNKNSQRVRIFLTDFASEIHEHEFSAYLVEIGVKLYNSAPYKHHQNLIERYIQTLKNMLRTVMSYNNVPPSYWCYAIMYTIDTYNMLQKSDQFETRSEIFTGEKTDVSKTVPFYSTGWAHIPETERKRKSTTLRAWRVKMLGYASPYKDTNYSNTIAFVKNSYIVWDLDNERELIRHDVVFQNYPDNLNMLSLSSTEREEQSSDTADPIEQFNYTNLMKDSIKDYTESEAKLPPPDEALIPIEDEHYQSEETAPPDQTSNRKFTLRRPREDDPPVDSEPRRSFRLRNPKTIVSIQC